MTYAKVDNFQRLKLEISMDFDKASEKSAKRRPDNRLSDDLAHQQSITSDISLTSRKSDHKKRNHNSVAKRNRLGDTNKELDGLFKEDDFKVNKLTDESVSL